MFCESNLSAAKATQAAFGSETPTDVGPTGRNTGDCRAERIMKIGLSEFARKLALLSRKGKKPGKVGRKMNKNILKTMTVGLACLTLCGTSLAAPGKPGNRAPQKAPTHQQAPAPRNERPSRAPTRPNTRRVAQPRPAPRPAPAPRRPAPPPPPERHHRPSEADGWLALGAAVLGGIVGGLLSAGN